MRRNTVGGNAEISIVDDRTPREIREDQIRQSLGISNLMSHVLAGNINTEGVLQYRIPKPQLDAAYHLARNFRHAWATGPERSLYTDDSTMKDIKDMFLSSEHYEEGWPGIEHPNVGVGIVAEDKLLVHRSTSGRFSWYIRPSGDVVFSVNKKGKKTGENSHTTVPVFTIYAKLGTDGSFTIDHIESRSGEYRSRHLGALHEALHIFTGVDTAKEIVEQYERSSTPADKVYSQMWDMNAIDSNLRQELITFFRNMRTTQYASDVQDIISSSIEEIKQRLLELTVRTGENSSRLTGADLSVEKGDTHAVQALLDEMNHQPKITLDAKTRKIAEADAFMREELNTIIVDADDPFSKTRHIRK